MFGGEEMGASGALEVDEGRLNRRDADEFLGVCRGLIADGELDESDFDFLVDWASASRRLDRMPVVSEICELVDEGKRRGGSPQVRLELLEALQKLVGGKNGGRLLSTALPLTLPPPALTFQGKWFCFTGEFDFGSRTKCEDAIVQRGGNMRDNLTLNTDYLIVGSLAAEDWIHSSYGTKIARAVRWRANGKRNIPIVSEKHWALELSRTQVSAVPGVKPATAHAVFRREQDETQDHISELYEHESELTSEEFERRWQEIKNAARYGHPLPPPPWQDHRASRAGSSGASAAWTSDATQGVGHESLQLEAAAEYAGRLVARVRRLPWYVLPLALFLMGYWYVSSHAGKPPTRAATVITSDQKVG
jgi:hypothetical protein